MAHKISTATTLFHSGNAHCTEKFIQEEIITVKNSLEINGYKQNLINKCLQTVQRKEGQNFQESEANIYRIRNYRYISVPYIKCVSERACWLPRLYDIKLDHKPVHTYITIKIMQRERQKANC